MLLLGVAEAAVLYIGCCYKFWPRKFVESRGAKKEMKAWRRCWSSCCLFCCSSRLILLFIWYCCDYLCMVFVAIVAALPVRARTGLGNPIWHTPAVPQQPFSEGPVQNTECEAWIHLLVYT